VTELRRRDNYNVLKTIRKYAVRKGKIFTVFNLATCYGGIRGRAGIAQRIFKSVPE